MVKTPKSFNPPSWAKQGVVQKLRRQYKGGRWSKNVNYCPRGGRDIKSGSKRMKLCPRSYWMTPKVSKAVLTEWQQQNMYSRLHLLTSLCFRWPHQSQLRGQIMHTRLVLLFDRSSVPRVGASIAIKTTQLLGALLVLLLLPACLLADYLVSAA